MTQTLEKPKAGKSSSKLEFKVAQMDDLGKFREAAEWGRKEIMLAEQEMPGLMAVREEYAKQQPLKGLKIVGGPAKYFDTNATGGYSMTDWTVNGVAVPNRTVK